MNRRCERPRSAPRPQLRLRAEALPAVFAAAIAASPIAASADPVESAVPVEGPNDIACVAAAAFAGCYATGDSFQDRVEVRNIRSDILYSIDRAQILTLAPWMTLDGGADGPSGLAFTASGRMLFVLVHDTVPGDGLGSDAVLRLDVSTGALTLQARLDLYNQGDTWPHLAAAHHRSFLYVPTEAGQLAVFLASSANAGAQPLAQWNMPGTGAIHGVAIDRDTGTLFAARGSGVYRAALPTNPAITPTFAFLANAPDVRALSWGDHYGAPSQRGLYIMRGDGSGGSRVDFINASAAATGTNVTPAFYHGTAAYWHDMTFTPAGDLLIGADEDAVQLRDSADPRLNFDAWMRDEVSQVTRMGRGLISPDAEPDGWVIDGDVIPAWNWFHPATPDAAAWVVCLLMANEAVNGDPNAEQDVERILVRYSGLAPDGVSPRRNADGIFKHWLNPATGDTEGTWPDEYATLSTMKIVFAAARAMARYPDNPIIVRAASRIIFLTRNWGSYIHSGSSAIAFKGLAAGGPDPGSWSPPFNEGIIFAEQVDAYGGSSGQWFVRNAWPTAQYLSSRPITVAAQNLFQPAFISLYPAIVSSRYRTDGTPNGWMDQVDDVRWSSAAWTDDSGPRYFTVFSAGTSPSGYNADTFTNHPGNITTFTSLLAFGATGQTAEAVGGYAAYRKGARQTFKTGASILYRRPYDGGAFVPNSAGMPDVALGALGLAELIEPGLIDNLLARPYPTLEMCPVDVNADGATDIEDLYSAIAAGVDLNGDGAATPRDWSCLRNWLRRNEPASLAR